MSSSNKRKTTVIHFLLFFCTKGIHISIQQILQQQMA